MTSVVGAAYPFQGVGTYCFRYASRFITLKLAHMLDTLVRVPRRVCKHPHPASCRGASRAFWHPPNNSTDLRLFCYSTNTRGPCQPSCDPQHYPLEYLYPTHSRYQTSSPWARNLRSAQLEQVKQMQVMCSECPGKRYHLLACEDRSPLHPSSRYDACRVFTTAPSRKHTASALAISSSFDSLFRVLCIFRSHYLCAIGLLAIFSFRRDISPT